MLAQDITKAHVTYEHIINDAQELHYKNVVEDPRAVQNFSLCLFRRLKRFMPHTIKKWDDVDIDPYFDLTDNKRRLRKPVELAARKYLIEQLRARGYAIKDIAQLLNLSRQSIYATLNV